MSMIMNLKKKKFNWDIKLMKEEGVTKNYTFFVALIK